MGTSVSPWERDVACVLHMVFRRPGRAVQVEPIKSMLEVPGTKRLKVQYVEPPSSFPFKFNLRRYSLEGRARRPRRGGHPTRAPSRWPVCYRA